MKENDIYWYWICNIDNIWNKKIGILLDNFETPKNVFYAKKNELMNIIGISEKNVDDIIKSRNSDKILEAYDKLSEKNILFITKESSQYPESLGNIINSPYSFYVKGNIEILNKNSVAVVGARNASEYGKIIAYKTGFELAANDICVISGMAAGIDSASQRGAIDGGGNTVAVLGCGVDVCYPLENIDLYENILENNGTIISEYPIGSEPLNWHFPLRNRIISGLASKVAVLEAREKSGSLITVEYALEQGKDVYALPGRITDKLSTGCNKLIKEGAGILTQTKDLLDDFDIQKLTCEKSKNNIVLAKELESVYSNVDLFPKSISEITYESGKKPEEVLSSLIQLQLMGLINEPTKNYYIKKL